MVVVQGQEVLAHLSQVERALKRAKHLTVLQDSDRKKKLPGFVTRSNARAAARFDLVCWTLILSVGILMIRDAPFHFSLGMHEG
jgi:hypothetical protein